MAPQLLDSQGLAFRQENPKRANTQAFQRYEAYKAAQTVQDARIRGASKADLANDIKQGFCTVLNASSAAAPIDKVQPVALVLDSPAGTRKRRPASPSGAAPAVVLDVAGPPAKKPAPTPAAQAAPAPAAPVALAAPFVPAAEVPSASVAASSSSALSSTAPAVAQRHSAVDLSFASFDGKPMKFIKRTMGEARKLLSPEGLQEAERDGYSFRILDRDALSKWAVTLRDLNPQGKLARDLTRHGLDPSIELELCLPDGFPLEPPFARVVYPELRGGFVFGHGGICFEPLTAKGWTPSMTLPSLAIAVKGILDYGEVQVQGVGDKKTRTVKHYTEEGARRDHAGIVAAHRGGESNTYGSLKSYSS